MVLTVNVLKFGTLVTYQKDLDKQCRPRSDCFLGSSLIWVFPVCYSDLVNSNPDNQHYSYDKEQKEEPSKFLIVYQIFRCSQIFLCYCKTATQKRQNKRTKILMTNDGFMKVKSIAECSPWSILQYF